MLDKKIRWRVLVFPAGMENGLEIWKSLKDCKEIDLYAATSRVVNHTEYVYKKCHYIKPVNEDGWLEDLNQVVKDNEIDFIYPANSAVIDALIREREHLCCKVALPDSDIVRLTRSKRNTIKALKDKVPVPRLFEDIDKIKDYPVFVKPDSGYGSQNTSLVSSREELDLFFKDKKIGDYVIQEYLPGKEYSVDCFSDSDNIVFCGARTRERVRMGTSMHSEIVGGQLAKQIQDIAESIYNRIKITGAWFFQLKEDSCGQFRLLEIDIRIAGTMALNRVRGVNFPLLTLYHFGGYPVSTMVNKYEVAIDRCLLNRYKTNIYFTKVYVDLDDTIILHKNTLNLDMVKFLYQCINKRIEVVLLSKNLEKDKEVYLKKFRIRDIFDKIIWIDELDKKSDYIQKNGVEDAIFIDDSFSQRREVNELLGIPTFDSSMIEVLLDDRY